MSYFSFFLFFIFTQAQAAETGFKVKAKSLYCSQKESYPVHLTFDDGPKIPETEMVLDILKNRKIKATFLISTSHLAFLNGKKVLSEKEKKILSLIQRMQEEGHTIGSHSYEHIEHANSEKYIEQEVQSNIENNLRVMKKLKNLVNIHAPIPFRFPYGSGWFIESNQENHSLADSVMKKIKKENFSPLHWDIDSWDWSKIKRKALPDSLLKQVCSHKGGVVLMHDIHPFTAENLNSIIDSIFSSKHKIVSYSEIKQYSDNMENGPLASFSSKTAGLFYCGKSVGGFDQIWKNCEEYAKKSTDIKKSSFQTESAQ